jgi:hypothetical protein
MSDLLGTNAAIYMEDGGGCLFCVTKIREGAGSTGASLRGTIKMA